MEKKREDVAWKQDEWDVRCGEKTQGEVEEDCDEVNVLRLLGPPYLS